MKHDFEDIQRRIELVTAKMLEKFPNCHYTIKTLLWDDGTSWVECRHGKLDVASNTTIIHTMVHYNGELTYETTGMVSNSVVEDGEGNLYYVPNEVLPYLRPRTIEKLNIEREETM